MRVRRGDDGVALVYSFLERVKTRTKRLCATRRLPPLIRCVRAVLEGTTDA